MTKQKQAPTTKLITSVGPNGPVNHVVAVDNKGVAVGGTHINGKAGTPNTCKPPVHVSKSVRRRDERLAKRIRAWEDAVKRNPAHQQHKPGSNK